AHASLFMLNYLYLLQATYTAAHPCSRRTTRQPPTSSHLHGGTQFMEAIEIGAVTSSHLHGGTPVSNSAFGQAITSSHLHGGTLL
ncbi:hypothetical protein ACOD7O_005587, partial [Pseudomonas aeruginosa]